MISIKTGYFDKIGTYKKLNYVPVAICSRSPVSYKGLEYKKLAPKYDFFIKWKNKIINDDQYVEFYKNLVLSELNQRKVIQDLMELSRSFKIVLLCWEKPDLFCHRHLVAEWLSKETDIKITEYDEEKSNIINEFFGD